MLEGTTINNNRSNNRSRDDLFINEQIRDREVRVISATGEQLGIMSAMEARKLAEEAELDLVKISPNARPPVCKIIDYGKYKYEKTRKEKDARKKQHTVEIKEIRMSPNIDSNDLNTKINAARKFLSKGDRVKVTLRLLLILLMMVSTVTSFLSTTSTWARRSLTMFLAAKK